MATTDWLVIILGLWVYAGVASFTSWYDRRYYFGKPWWLATFHLISYIFFWWAIPFWVVACNVYHYDLVRLLRWVRRRQAQKLS